MAILTINSGSSSLKLGLYGDDGETLLLSSAVSGIGKPGSSVKMTRADGSVAAESTVRYAHLHDAFAAVATQMLQQGNETVTAIGHRMVHGGPHLTTDQLLTKRVVQILRDSVHFAPLHIPPALDLVRHVEGQFPGVPQFACFDTVFHQTMPAEASTYAIPKLYRDAGVRRYGFHGLSYESVVHALGKDVPERVIVAHLGSGASACALLHGKSVDTSMGVSPTGGFAMSTRTGDLDPGVALLLERSLAPDVPVLTPDELERTVNEESGLKALAGEADMQKLLARTDADATLAVAVFCRGVAKTIAGYATVLGGVDLLVFTGGIGEHSAAVRARVGERLQVLGVVLDGERNGAAKGAAVISADDALITVRVMVADENAVIARHVAQMNG